MNHEISIRVGRISPTLYAMSSQGQILSSKANSLEKAALFHDALQRSSAANDNLADVANQVLQPGTKVRANVAGFEQEVHAEVVLCIASHHLVSLNVYESIRISKATVSLADITAIV